MSLDADTLDIGTHTSGEDVVVVDENDVAIGVVDKLAAHQPPGVRHRAFSVFGFNATGQVLLQRRAPSKYHFAGMWSNTCCSHPRPGETIAAAARRRMIEEVGLESHDVVDVGTFEYHAIDHRSGLVEHEIDHVVRVRVDDEPVLNLAEADSYEWTDAVALRGRVDSDPLWFTPWLAPALDVLLSSETG